MLFVICRQSLPNNRHVAEGALGGGESFTQQAGLTIAFCGSYVNPFVLDAADGTRGGGESLTWQAGQLIASCGSYVHPDVVAFVFQKKRRKMEFVMCKR